MTIVIFCCPFQTSFLAMQGCSLQFNFSGRTGYVGGAKTKPAFMCPVAELAACTFRWCDLCKFTGKFDDSNYVITKADLIFVNWGLGLQLSRTVPGCWRSSYRLRLSTSRLAFVAALVHTFPLAFLHYKGVVYYICVSCSCENHNLWSVKIPCSSPLYACFVSCKKQKCSGPSLVWLICQPS